MMLASQLHRQRFDVCLYEQNAAPGRKFLVAGKGGFNLTHAEDLGRLVQRYTPAPFFEEILHAFSNSDLQRWLLDIGIPTYTGTSQRVFPVKGVKPVQVLNAVLDRLKANGVELRTHHRWTGFSKDGSLLFETPAGLCKVQADIVVFALGGASWPVTGANGYWTTYLAAKGITCLPFRSSNCAFGVSWPAGLPGKAEGLALKNCEFTCNGISKKGEAVLTRFGIEGSGVYALSPAIRGQLDTQMPAILHIDLKPALSEEEIRQRLERRGTKPVGKYLESDLKLGEAAILLLRSLLSKDDFMQPAQLAAYIKHLRLEIISLAPVDEAISTVGGVALTEIDQHFELKKLPGHYAIGEMLDWDASTGGYLLQACFSMGYSLARHLNNRQV